MARAFLFSILLASILCGNNAAQSQDLHTLLKNTSITPVMFDASKKTPNLSKVKIKVSDIKVKPGTDINSLLKEKRIVPDADSYSMIYRLNPEVTDLSKLPAGTKISLPTITSESAKGYQFELQVDKDIKDSIKTKLKDAEALQMRVQNVASLSTESLEVEAKFKSNLQKFVSLSKLNYELTAGGEKKLPVTRNFMEQVDADINAANAIASKALSSGTFTFQDVKTLASIAKDLEIKNDGLNQIMGVGLLPEPITQAELTINLLEQNPQTRTTYPYRVHYATISGHLRHEDHKFSKLAQTVSENLERGNYLIWAVRDSDGVKVTNGLHEVPVRPPKTQSDITVIDAP